MAHTTCNSAADYLKRMRTLLDKVDTDAIDAYVDVIFRAWRDDRKVYVFGNGGGAYTASHHVTDYVKTAAVEGQKRLAAFSLIDNWGLTTAIGNDLSYDEIFAYPLASYGKAGDVAVAISCSGNSENVVRACRWARDNGLTVVALTGFTGGQLKDLADVHVHVPNDNYGLVEDLHLSIGHILAQSLQSRIREESAIGEKHAK